MITIADASIRQQLRDRLEGLTPDAPRQWGSMTPNQMLCHLTDAFRLAIGERGGSAVDTWFTRNIIRGFALYAPLQWPKGVPTRPEADQKIGGTPPTQFAADKNLLLNYFDRFCRQPRDFTPGAHPIFGKMSAKEWDRWAYLHMDHHLRQFGQ